MSKTHDQTSPVKPGSLEDSENCQRKQWGGARAPHTVKSKLLVQESETPPLDRACPWLQLSGVGTMFQILGRRS